MERDGSRGPGIGLEASLSRAGRTARRLVTDVKTQVTVTVRGAYGIHLPVCVFLSAWGVTMPSVRRIMLNVIPLMFG